MNQSINFGRQGGRKQRFMCWMLFSDTAHVTFVLRTLHSNDTVNKQKFTRRTIYNLFAPDTHTHTHTHTHTRPSLQKSENAKLSSI